VAVPTLTSATPSSGPAGGRALVTLVGTNFRTYTPPASGYVGGSAPVYVQVLFAGQVAWRTEVISDTDIVVQAPPYVGDPDLDRFPAVDVTVKNLDDSFVPIPGEEVTLSSAYTYEREPLRPPTLETESPFGKVTRAILRLVKRQFFLGFGPATHTDFSSDGIKLLDAGMPSISLGEPNVIPDAYGWECESPVVEVNGEVLIFAPAIMHTLVYTIKANSDNEAETFALAGLLRKICWRNPYLLVDADIPADSVLRLPFVMTSEPTISVVVGDANLKSISAEFEVRQVPVLYLPAHLSLGATGAAEVATILLQVQKLTGTLVETTNL
jgi:hypothetical protein